MGRPQVRYQHETLSHISCQKIFLLYIILGFEMEKKSSLSEKRNEKEIQPSTRNCCSRMMVSSKNSGVAGFLITF